MARVHEALERLGNGQRVRLTFDDATEIELRVTQREYSPGERLRLELSSDESADRYRLESRVGRDGWGPVSFSRYSRDGASWVTRGDLSGVDPLDTFRTFESDDMRLQSGLGG